ncbi:glycosyltransferase family 2 protein [Halorubellus litoreus]|uniref:Glycosyltransferase family 2 protein n=1 Tax=Halorubellus litoreus TaxID=755308 RepID=A0ABD5VFZ1_9EURY
MAEYDKGLSIIILNYHSDEDTIELANSVSDLPYETIVVDSSSTINKEKFNNKSIQYFDLGENLGYAGGNNYGIQNSRADNNSILILNPDVRIENEDIRECFRFLKSESIGLLTPRIVDEKGQQRYDLNTYPLPTLRTLGLLPSFKSTINKFTPTDYVVGCAIFINDELIEDIGLMNEDFFMYHEEVEYSIRARKAGYDIGVYTEAKATHRESEKIHQHPYQAYYDTRNKIHMKRVIGKGSAILYVALLIPLLSKRLFRSLVFNRELIMPLILSIFDGVRGQKGKKEQYHNN